jgi:hypothetical protein
MKTKVPVRMLTSLSVLLLLTACASHGRVSAVGISDNQGDQLCSDISTRTEAVQDKISARQEALLNSWQTQSDKIEIISETRDKDVEGLRAHIDDARSQNAIKMRKLAADDDEEKAVDTYVSAVSSAVHARRQSVDTARTQFRSDVKKLAEARQATLAGQVEALRISIADAYTTAKSGCSDGTDPSAVQAALAQQLAAAKQGFIEKRATDNQLGIQIKQLASTRRDAVKAADTTFLQNTIVAKDALRTSPAGKNPAIVAAE